MTPLRIVHADTDDLGNPLRGGQPVRTFEVNARLAPYHRITVLTATYPGCERRVRRSGIDYRRLGVTVPRFGLSSHLSYLACLGLAIRRIPHDLVVEEFMPPAGFGMLPWFTRKPVVSLVQWFFFAEWERRYGLPFERIMRDAGRRARYRHFLVQTDRMGQYFRDLLPHARIWKLGCGVAEDLFRSPQPGGDYALFLGRLAVEQKGLDLLIEAWAAIRQDGVVIPLRIAGEGPGRAYLEARIAARGLGDCVTLLGRQEGADKRAALHGCAFVVMPSRAETFGIVAAEAMAAAKPVVAFDIDHLNEVLTPGWAILAGAPAARGLAGAVLRIWRNPAERDALGAAAHRAAGSYRWAEIARRQGEIYSEVCAVAGTAIRAKGDLHG